MMHGQKNINPKESVQHFENVCPLMTTFWECSPYFCYSSEYHYGTTNALFTLCIRVHLQRLQPWNLFCTMTKNCAIILRIISLLHVSTISCHP